MLVEATIDIIQEDFDDDFPRQAPPQPNVKQSSCITTVQELIDREMVNPSSSLSTNTPRVHVICPGTTLTIRYLDHYQQQPIVVGTNSQQQQQQPMIPLRSNMNLRCGDNGQSENMCIISDGYIQLDGTSPMMSTTTMMTPPSQSTLTEEELQLQQQQQQLQLERRLDNIIIEGFTFVGGSHSKHSLLVQRPGSITFIDCIWREFTKAVVPIMLDYYNPYPDDIDGNDELVMTLQDCVLEDNTYFGTESHPALIMGNGDQNRIIIESTTFQYNDMMYNNTKPSNSSFLIQSIGPVCLDRVCFIDNYVGAANVAVFGNSLSSSQIYVTTTTTMTTMGSVDDDDMLFDDDNNSTSTTNNNDTMVLLPSYYYNETQRHNLCQYAAVFQTIDQYERMKPICIQPTATTCTSGDGDDGSTSSGSTCTTPQPTSFPTATPPPVVVPTTVPTTSPTSSSPSVSTTNDDMLETQPPISDVAFNDGGGDGDGDDDDDDDDDNDTDAPSNAPDCFFCP